MPIGGGDNLVGVFDPSQKESLPSFGRFLVRDGDVEPHDDVDDDADVIATDMSAKTFYSRDSGKCGWRYLVERHKTLYRPHCQSFLE